MGVYFIEGQSFSKFAIYNENKEPIMKAKGNLIGIGKTITVTDNSGKELIKVQKKVPAVPAAYKITDLTTGTTVTAKKKSKLLTYRIEFPENNWVIAEEFMLVLFHLKDEYGNELAFVEDDEAFSKNSLRKLTVNDPKNDLLALGIYIAVYLINAAEDDD